MFVSFSVYLSLNHLQILWLIFSQAPFKRVSIIRSSTSFLNLVETSLQDLPLFVGWCLLSTPLVAQGTGVIQGAPHHCLWVFLHLSHMMGLLFSWMWCPFLSEFMPLFGWSIPSGSFLKIGAWEISFEQSLSKNGIILSLFLVDNLAGYNLLDWKSYPLEYFVEDIECFQNFKCSLVLFLS